MYKYVKKYRYHKKVASIYHGKTGIIIKKPFKKSWEQLEHTYKSS